MKFQTYLIKYGEIGIKGKNRYMFEDALVRQIRHSLKDLDGLFHTYKAQGRVYVDCDGDYDGDEVVEALKRVFGIVGICPVVRVEDKGFEELKKDVIAYMDEVYPDKNIRYIETVTKEHKMDFSRLMAYGNKNKLLETIVGETKEELVSIKATALYKI